jgi:N-acetylmuramoyl-L-alanine amidase
MDSRKWNDIAYNFLIAPSGRVYEGRGKEVEGAHTQGHNNDCGIAFLGDYTTTKLTKAQITAYKLLRRKLGISGGPAIAHSKTSSTSCPGAMTKKQLGL